MAIIDDAAIAKFNKTLVNKLYKFCRNLNCSKGNITDSQDGKVFTFEFENDGVMASDLKYIITNDPRAVCTFAVDYDGSYDWKSDTYAKPTSIVQYHF